MTGAQKDDVSTSIDEILALNASMLDLAQVEDWVGVCNLEAARGALLKAVFEGQDRPSPEVLTALIQKVLESDGKLIELGQQARSGVSAELTQLRQLRKARSAYAENGSE